MLKVFIADDEVFIVELLKHLIDWDSMGLEIVGTANDGITALQQIRETEPHIVITDIRMPNIDGLELVRQVAESHPKTVFIIVSGHKNFQYAQTAMRYGVKDYLLKPINAKALAGILTSIIAEINFQRSQGAKISEINEKLNVAQFKLYESFLERICSDSPAPFVSLESVNREYMLRLEPGVFLLFYLKIDHLSPLEDAAFLESLYNELLPDILRELGAHCFELIYSMRGSKCVFVANLKDEELPGFNQSLQKLVAESEKKLQKYSNLYLTVLKGCAKNSLEGLANSCDDAGRALRSRIIYGLNTVIEAPPRYSSKADRDRIFTQAEKDSLLRSIEKFNVLEIKSQIIKLFAIAENEHIDHADFYWDLIGDIYARFLNAIQSLGIVADINQEAAAFRAELEECLSINALKLALLQKVQGYIAQYESAEDNSENISVSIVKKYISEHYREKLSLNDVAQLVFLNPVYFSVLFKRETGTNFIDYINNYRVDVSKKYLKRIEYPLTEVAELSGFSNVKYFSKTFKKNVGITPTQYRSKYMRHGIGAARHE